MTATTFAEFWGQMPEETRSRRAASFATLVEKAGLTVFKADEQRFIPIPITLTPELIDDELLTFLSKAASMLLSATVKLANWTLDGRGAKVGERLYSAFTPLERACLLRQGQRIGQVATARVDYFVDSEGIARALELNATIPAMQGYSDIIAHSWLRMMTMELGTSHRPDEGELIARAGSNTKKSHRPDEGELIARAGSNTKELLESLVAHYEGAGGKARQPSILVVCRRGDAQLGELLHYVRAFREAGHDAEQVFVDEVDVDSAGRMGARGRRFDLLYRHIFARRIEPESILGRLLVDPGQNVVLNPVVSPLEVKGMLALLHQAEEQGMIADYGLTDDEVTAVRQIVPWTRILDHSPAKLSDGTLVPDLASFAAQNPARLVLKRSWDYGGKSVVLGPDCPDWQARVGSAGADRDVWILQEYVAPRTVRHLLFSDGKLSWRDLFVDTSAYANHGVCIRPSGGVCRASGSKIVNILGGGGLTPLIPTSVANRL